LSGHGERGAKDAKDDDYDEDKAAAAHLVPNTPRAVFWTPAYIGADRLSTVVPATLQEIFG
jgi:hypothetical protein